ncbi:permease [Desulfosporosinus metallidurans]|uniref:Protein yraQ n=1 Tax=Desulfosporosinus metallidurans TaxID=1888891 RepID=A0A1Q8QKF7_9FIRM|nr:permease [Desulfosporosinus metallidurans]OLN27816.1 protein yraQ [Desulfosporosinus metallidurans]
MPEKILRFKETNQPVTRKTKLNYLIPVLIFFVIAIIGVWYVKWSPYYQKVFVAASKHSIGASIISGKLASSPLPSWQAALSYTTAYFNAVWKAVILGLLLGSLVQVLLPQEWIKRALGSTSFGSTLLGGVAAIPSMMCTCCAAPVTVGLRKSSASVGSSLAYWLGNPILNPATIIFMGFVLSWKFALMRIIAGLILVFGIAYIANYLTNIDEVECNEEVITLAPSITTRESFFVRWWRALWPLILDTIPAYIIMVFLLGGLRAWLFPVISPQWATSGLVLIFLAITGTLFIVPTAAEIPIVQTLMSFGLGVGPAVALMMTLPAISLPSLLIVKRAFSTRILIFVTGSVFLVGVVSGLIAMVIF